MGSLDADDRRLLRTLGTSFLSYLLNANEANLGPASSDDLTLSDEQDAVLAQLLTLLRSVHNTQIYDVPAYLEWSRVLGFYMPEQLTTLVNTFRVATGGTVDVDSGGTSTGDSLTRSLGVIARDIYPLFLLARPSGMSIGSAHVVSTSIYRHPARQEFVTAVMAHEVLARLFPDEDEEGVGPHGNHLSNTGHGSNLSVSMLADLLLTSAWSECRLRDMVPPLLSFIATIAEQLENVIKAVGGQAAQIPVMFGIVGTLLPEGTTVDLGWGHIRRPTPGELDFAVDAGLTGAVEYVAASGAHVLMHHGGDVVLDMSAAYGVRMVANLDRPTRWNWRPPNPWAELWQRVESLRLAYVLAFPDQTPSALLSSWHVLVDPLSRGLSTGSAPALGSRSFSPRQLTDADAQEWGLWTRRVHDLRTPSLDIAIRRVLRAVGERDDPADVLIDAVIAWESLFGSGEGEPTLRVSSALAWLLEPSDVKARDLARIELKELYRLRSKVVHGAISLTGDHRAGVERTLAVAVDALRILFTTRSDLITTGEDKNQEGTGRSARLMMGG